MSTQSSIVVHGDAPPNVPAAQMTVTPEGKRILSVMVECSTPAFGAGPMADRGEIAKVLAILMIDVEQMKLSQNGMLTIKDRDGNVVGFATMQGE